LTYKLEGLGSGSLATKPSKNRRAWKCLTHFQAPYANFLRKDMVTFEGSLGTLTVPKNFDHLVYAHTRPTRQKVPACLKKY